MKYSDFENLLLSNNFSGVVIGTVVGATLSSANSKLIKHLIERNLSFSILAYLLMEIAIALGLVYLLFSFAPILTKATEYNQSKRKREEKFRQEILQRLKPCETWCAL